MRQAIKEAIGSLVEAVKKNPAEAASVFRASTYSEADTFTTRSRIRGFDVKLDEPRELGGEDVGPNPVEAVLAALGSCQEIVYRAYAAMLGLRIERIEVHAKGHLDLRGLLGLADVRAGFTHVAFTTRIVSPEPVERLRELADVVQKHCPVLDLLAQPVPVSGTLEVARPGAGEAIEVVGASTTAA